MKYIIEIATSDYLTTKAAIEGGADRIELCANLGEGGTTPSFGLIKKCREAFSIPIYPIIRPRGGDFLFNDEDRSFIGNNATPEVERIHLGKLGSEVKDDRCIINPQ